MGNNGDTRPVLFLETLEIQVSLEPESEGFSRDTAEIYADGAWLLKDLCEKILNYIQYLTDN